MTGEYAGEYGGADGGAAAELAEADLAGTEETGRNEGPLPVVAIVGRPNVGKSTLVNRILGRREAVVEDVPGVTRDRVTYEASWRGRRFTLVDTGGWDPDATGMGLRIAEQAQVAAELADVIVFVGDATGGGTDADEKVDELQDRAVATLLDQARADPNKLDGVYSLLDIAHVLERMADRTTNIAERVIFIATSATEELNP